MHLYFVSSHWFCYSCYYFFIPYLVLDVFSFFLFFFFKQKTAYVMLISDWSADVFSSDLGCRRLWRGDVPPVPPRLLQGASVPRFRLVHPRDAPRAGHALLWRAQEAYPADLLGDDGGDAADHRRRHRGRVRLRRLLFEGRHPRGGLCRRRRRSDRLLGRHLRGAADELLFMASRLPDLLR